MTIKRYEPSNHRSADFGMAEQGNGKWVSYEDYVQLNAKLEMLKEGLKERQIDIERVQAQSNFYRSKLIDETEYTQNVNTLDQVKHLEAKIERLTKAGDFLANEYDHCWKCLHRTPSVPSSVSYWLSAKEGN